jgi:hypothetical protein
LLFTFFRRIVNAPLMEARDARLAGHVLGDARAATRIQRL